VEQAAEEAIRRAMAAARAGVGAAARTARAAGRAYRLTGFRCSSPPSSVPPWRAGGLGGLDAVLDDTCGNLLALHHD
jgi:hypothetical protein